MQSTSSLASRLQNNFKQFQFKSGDNFYWDPSTKMIFYPPQGDPALLLHELGHALLDHQEYTRDIQLVEMEQEAWQYAQSHLAMSYGVEIKDAIIQDALDTYREWLHSRSICPICASTGLQVKEKTYNCLVCHAKWKVNEARLCGLKRTLLTTK